MAEEREDLVFDLLALLGEDGYFTLCDAYAGLKLFVPSDPSRSDLPKVIGDRLAGLLSRSYPGGYIRVPLARQLRARRYRAADMSNRDIAKKLGLTESAVEKIFNREKREGRELISKRNPHLQLDFFSNPEATPPRRA